MDTQRPTIKDIAKKAGVSYSTVSRVLSNSSLISPETKEYVLRVCDEMGYTPNYLARSLVARHSGLLGLMLPSLSNPFMAQLAHSIEKYARRYKYNIMVCNSGEDHELEQQVYRLLLGHQVDGVLIFPVDSESSLRLSRLNPQQVPVVFFNDSNENAPGNIISTDNYKGSYIGVEYLVSLGHRDILYFSPKPLRASHKQRAKGYTAACIDQGIVPHLYYNDLPGPQTDSLLEDMELGYEMALELFRNSIDSRYTAIFSRTDTMALGIIKAADEYGIRIPQDFSLLGFDDISYAALPKIHLTTIRQPVQQMALLGIQSIVSTIEKKEGEAAQRSIQLLEPQLIERSSCARRI